MEKLLSIAERIMMFFQRIDETFYRFWKKSEDIKIIKELEHRSGLVLVHCEQEKMYFHSSSYTIDDRGNVTALTIRYKEIIEISFLSKLKNLEYLDLRSNKLTDISALSGLPKLAELMLTYNQLSNISALSELTQLTRLFLSLNKLTDISALEGLTNLTELYLGSNQVTDISVLSRLSKLTMLELGNNKLTDVSALSRLNQLTLLDLSMGQLTDISALSGLINLTKLYLSHNQLEDISILSGLSNLEELALSDNKFVSISPLVELTNLTKLYLSQNQLTDISPLSRLKKLRLLDVSHNKITKISQQLLKIDSHRIQYEENYNGIYLEGNPLECPPIEIVKRGPNAVREYFQQTKQEPSTIPLHETKLLIVGNGEVGKTTLMKKLKDPKRKLQIGNEPTTHGINIQPWQLECSFENHPPCPIDIHFWDFGGQEIYHSTHQFFLTKRSVYLFVWEARKDEDDPQIFDYWLNIIKLLSKDSPVIMVLNKADVRIKTIDESTLQETFPNIRAFHTVSCKTGQGIAELTESIRQTLSDMPHLHDQLPKTWKTIRDELRNRSQNQNHIPRQDYLDLCDTHKLDEMGADVLSDYIHDLGTILHFRNDRLLENMVILKPEWATNAVYKLVDTEAITLAKGQFHFDDLKTYWDKDDYPREKHAQLIRLMEEFELCFPIPGSNLHIIPELLPPERPAMDFKRYSGDNVLRFLYRYPFMPGGIVSRFIARNYFLVKDEHYWKNGVEICFGDATALVVGDRHNRKLTVSVLGGQSISELMGIIKNELEYIHRTLNMEKNIHYSENIPCPCMMCIRSATPYLFRYDMLRRRLDKGGTIIDCRDSDEEIELSRLLRGFIPDPSKPLDFTEALLGACHSLLGYYKNLRGDEDGHTDFIGVLLEARGLQVSIQGRWGRSETGESIGRPDMRKKGPHGETAGVIEAFRLKGKNTTTVTNHLQKLFQYDPAGCRLNYALVYVEGNDFDGLWKWYKGFIGEIEYDHPLVKEKRREETTGYTNIRAIRARHMREKRETEVYHIFVHLPG